MTMAGVKVCVFDAYGTLFDLEGIIRTLRAELADQADALLRLWRRRQLEISWLPLRPGAKADFWRVTEEALDNAMDELRIADRGLRGRLMEGWLAPVPYPEVIESLKALRAMGYPAAILSNGSLSMLDGAVLSLEGNLDAVLSVESVGRFKPDPKVYQLATAHFGLAPESVCFVSANAWDVTGAAAFGFKVAWINRVGKPGDSWPQGTLAAVSTLSELLPILGG